MERVAIFTENAVGGRTWGGGRVLHLLSLFPSPWGLRQNCRQKWHLGQNSEFYYFVPVTKSSPFDNIWQFIIHLSISSNLERNKTENIKNRLFHTIRPIFI